MTDRDDILAEIKDFIDLLDSPLNSSEIKNGWTPKLQNKWKTFYQNMYEYIQSGKSILKKPEYTSSICRALDFSGIKEGDLFDNAIHIEYQLRHQIEEKEKLALKKKNRLFISIILCLIFVSLFITKYYLYDFWRVPQGGMYPTIPDSKRFLCKRNPYQAISEVKRGDIVVFKAEWKNGKQYDFIWRVVGVPEDDVLIQDDKVVINGKALVRTEIREEGNLVIYLEISGNARYEVAYQKDRSSKDATQKEFHVPENHIFVLGDNRDNALDSREMGMIPFDSIIAKKVGFN